MSACKLAFTLKELTMRLFKRKNKGKVIQQKKDFQDFNIILNMKTLMLFEEMSGKSFYNLDEQDFELLIYCSLVVNNDQKLTYSQFKLVMKHPEIAQSLYLKCQKEMDFMAQFNRGSKEYTAAPKEDMGKISEIISVLIINYNMDASYVMEKLRLWELSTLVKQMENKTKADMVEKRFWTYMQILPHIDGKKCKSPEKLLPFPWEKDTEKQNTMKFMEDNKDAIKAFFNKNKEDGAI